MGIRVQYRIDQVSLPADRGRVSRTHPITTELESSRMRKAFESSEEGLIGMKIAKKFRVLGTEGSRELRRVSR